jgi:dihydroorotase
MNLLIKNGRIIDPSQDLDATLDLLVSGGRIKELGPGLKAPADTPTVDAAGCYVTPGLIDMHVHLRDPGLEYKEDIASGSRAAAAGGFTTIACMPNTKPVIDNQAVASYILTKAQSIGLVNVLPVGTITAGGRGERLAEMGELKESGCVAVSDDGRPVADAELMRRALEYARGIGILVISHAEELSLVGEGVMNEGFTSTELGLKGIPRVAEDIATAREVMLAEYTGSPLHVAHVSTRGAVRIIREAKARGVKVTCETAPHYFTLTDDAVRGYNTNAKMNPPLREADDVAAIKEGLQDGTIDCIATDHAPHHIDEKDLEFNVAMNGIVGLETSLPLGLRLVEEGVLTLAELVTRMALNPARILGIARGTLQPGAVADITVVDPQREWTVAAEKLASKSKNSPFLGTTMRGAAACTILAGKVVYRPGK